jgi:signal transduction histidine kinase
VLAGVGERAAGATIRVELVPNDFKFACDRRLMTMLLTQYVDNACKYSDADRAITIRAECSEQEILFSVHSFGATIPAADRERIFDRYFRSSATTTRAEGTGIGLSIAKRAAMAHGGSVWVSSDESEGTTFFAAIPTDNQAEDDAPSTRATERNN